MAQVSQEVRDLLAESPLDFRRSRDEAPAERFSEQRARVRILAPGLARLGCLAFRPVLLGIAALPVECSRW